MGLDRQRLVGWRVIRFYPLVLWTVRNAKNEICTLERRRDRFFRKKNGMAAMNLAIRMMLPVFILVVSLHGDSLDSLVASKRVVVLYEKEGAQMICGGVMADHSPPITNEKEIVKISILFDSVFSGQIKKISHVKDLSPEFVKKASAYFHDNLANTADPTEQFSSTDVIRSPKMPSRRLIFAGESGSYKFIYFEQGGRGYSTIFYLTKGDSLEFKDVLFSKAKSINQLKTFFNSKYQ